MNFKLYTPTQAEFKTLTLESYYQKNKEKCNNEDGVLLEGKLIFASDNGNKYEMLGFITNKGYVVVDDWDMFSELLMSPISPRIYVLDENNNYEYPVFYVPEDHEDQTETIIFALHPDITYDENIVAMMGDLSDEEWESTLKEYNYPQKGLKSALPKIK